MRRLVVVAAAVGTLTMPAQASSADRMGHLLIRFNYDREVQGEFLLNISGIAADCGDKVDKPTLAIWQSRMDSYAPWIASRIDHGYARNPMQDAWSGMKSDSVEQACLYAEGRWGEDGDMMPGVLRKNIEGE